MQKITNYFKAHTCLNNLVTVYVKESWCWEAEETEAHRSRIAKNSIDWEFIDGHVMPGVMVSGSLLFGTEDKLGDWSG